MSDRGVTVHTVGGVSFTGSIPPEGMDVFMQWLTGGNPTAVWAAYDAAKRRTVFIPLGNAALVELDGNLS